MMYSTQLGTVCYHKIVPTIILLDDNILSDLCLVFLVHTHLYREVLIKLLEDLDQLRYSQCLVVHLAHLSSPSHRGSGQHRRL